MTRVIDDRHTWAVRNPVLWWFSAERLKDAAEAVLGTIPEKDRMRDPFIPEGWVKANASPDLAGVFLYLAFLSLENLVKGIWIRGHSEIDATEVFEHIGHHRLRDLFRDANITLEPGDADLLRLAKDADALGRFPVPRSADAEIALDDSVGLDLLNATFQRLYERLRDELMDGVPGDP